MTSISVATDVEASQPAHRGSAELAAFGRTTRALEQALAAHLEVTAQLAEVVGEPAAEFLELGRLTLHRRVDDVIDAEALRHPSPHRLIARTARYAELLEHARANGVAA